MPGSNMKIILSRKGFDSSAGGVPSPILPEGRIVSLPIPDPRSPVRYGEIGSEGRDIAALVSNLTGGRIRRSSRAHLDPDLLAGDRPRPCGWRPVFGQEGAAQGHLHNQGVGPGDLFVFFGLFQRVLWRRGRYRFDRKAPRVHLIWGWLQVDSVIAVDDCPESIRTRIGNHPHLARPLDRSNTIYLARRSLTLPDGSSPGLPGSGHFRRLSSSRVLTDPVSLRPGLWRLPVWFAPGDAGDTLSYHRRKNRWRHDGDQVLLQSAGRGQEFVLDTAHRPPVTAWLRELFEQPRVYRWC